jgi:hypothetical protein
LIRHTSVTVRAANRLTPDLPGWQDFSARTGRAATSLTLKQRLRGKLIETVAESKSAEGGKDNARSHNNPGRCRGCGFRQACRDSSASE